MRLGLQLALTTEERGQSHQPIVFETGGPSGSGGGSKVSDVAAYSADGCLIRVCFKTPVFGAYHADLSSLRRLGVTAVAAPVLEQLTLAVAGFVVFVTGMIAVAAHHETATLSSHCCRNKKPQG